jgi:DNA-binding transcriptional LysR family regulator
LTIGCYTPFAAGNLRATLAEQFRRFPEVEITTVYGPAGRLLADLGAGSIDIAIVTAGSSAWNDKSLPLWSERVVVAIPQRHRLSEKDVVRWSDLRGEHFISNQDDPGPELRRLLLIKLGSPQNYRLSLHNGSIEQLLSLVGADFGVALATEGTTGAAYEGAVYRELRDDDGCARLNFLACWAQRNSNPTLGPFLEMLRERYPDLSGNQIVGQPARNADSSSEPPA